MQYPAGHGHAGLASNFVDLAHVKAKPGGTLALVLPITAIQGSSWGHARKLLADTYENITVATIANIGNRERAFSADTGMVETLIVATKKTDTVNSAPVPRHSSSICTGVRPAYWKLPKWPGSLSNCLHRQVRGISGHRLVKAVAQVCASRQLPK